MRKEELERIVDYSHKLAELVTYGFCMVATLKDILDTTDGIAAQIAKKIVDIISDGADELAREPKPVVVKPAYPPPPELTKEEGERR